MGIETKVAGHYARSGLEDAILAGLTAMGKDPERIDPADLTAVDEFHMGGHEATAALASRLGLDSDMMVLDLGCGIGGTARSIARLSGARVAGIDLTADYVAVAKSLTRRAGLADRVTFRTGSVLDLPFEDRCFDAATMLHVGMNIPDKGRLCREVHRVLKPGGAFAIYDVMRTGAGELAFPLPWASEPGTSFLDTPAVYREALQAAGFPIAEELDRRDLAIAFFARIRARMAEGGPPPLGLHVLMGADAPAKLANVVQALEEGIIAPVEMIARRGSV
jgi:SAM-dependent methyltransferase